MKHKMKDAKDCDKVARKELKTSKENLGAVVRVGTIASNEFMNMVNAELNLIWNNRKAKNNQKVEWANNRNEVIKENTEMFKGVTIGDKQLEEFEKVVKKGKKRIRTVCLWRCGVER